MGRASTHPLSRVFEAAGGVSPGSMPPIDMRIQHDGEIERIMELIGLITHGIQIRQVLYLWGLGFTYDAIVEPVGVSLTTVKSRADSGFAVIEAMILGRYCR